MLTGERGEWLCANEAHAKSPALLTALARVLYRSQSLKGGQSVLAALLSPALRLIIIYEVTAKIICLVPAGVTQLVECQLPKLNVASSSLVARF